MSRFSDTSFLTTFFYSYYSACSNYKSLDDKHINIDNIFTSSNNVSSAILSIILRLHYIQFICKSYYYSGFFSSTKSLFAVAFTLTYVAHILATSYACISSPAAVVSSSDLVISPSVIFSHLPIYLVNCYNSCSAVFYDMNLAIT